MPARFILIPDDGAPLAVPAPICSIDWPTISDIDWDVLKAELNGGHIAPVAAITPVHGADVEFLCDEDADSKGLAPNRRATFLAREMGTRLDIGPVLFGPVLVVGADFHALPGACADSIVDFLAGPGDIVTHR